MKLSFFDSCDIPGNGVIRWADNTLRPVCALLGGKHYKVVHITEDHQHLVVSSTPKISHWLKTAFVVASYFTILIPVIALSIKSAIRQKTTFGSPSVTTLELLDLLGGNDSRFYREGFERRVKHLIEKDGSIDENLLDEIKDAASKGNASASVFAACYLREVGLYKQAKKQFQSIKKAAQEGYAPACYCMAKCFFKLKKLDLANDLKEGVSYLKQAAGKNYPPATTLLASVYFGQPYVKEVPINLKKGEKLLSKAAAQGYPSAMFLLAINLLTQLGPSPDYPTIYSLLLKAAENGHVGAMTKLGQAYKAKSPIVEHLPKETYDDEMAKWFTLSAEKGNQLAQQQIAKLHFQGDLLPHDQEKAAAIWASLAEKGVAEAQYQYAQCLKNGWGCDQDDDTADYWFSQASKNGYDPFYSVPKLYYSEDQDSE